MTTKDIADRLVELCKAGKNLEALDTLFSDKIVSVEAMGNEAMPAVTEGLVELARFVHQATGSLKIIFLSKLVNFLDGPPLSSRRRDRSA